MAAAKCCPALDAGAAPAPPLPLVRRIFFAPAGVHFRTLPDLYHQAAHSKLRVCSRVRCDRAGLISICEPACERSRRVRFCELARCCLGPSVSSCRPRHNDLSILAPRSFTGFSSGPEPSTLKLLPYAHVLRFGRDLIHAPRANPINTSAPPDKSQRNITLRFKSCTSSVSCVTCVVSEALLAFSCLFSSN
jgi:hypothetical protein